MSDKRRLIIHALFTLAAIGFGAPIAVAQSSCPPVLDHRAETLAGQSADLCQYRGKVLLIVNTASQCGYTPQYAGLERLHRQYGARGLVVLGFPANDFGAQEPGSNREIATFCEANYGVTFPLFAKSAVVGSKAHPVFIDLARRSGEAPSWNFHKYLVDRRGERVTSFASAVEPESRTLIAAIERALAAR